MHFNFFQYYTAEFCEKMDLRMGKRPKNFGVSGYFGSKNFGVSGYLYEINLRVSGFVCIFAADFQIVMLWKKCLNANCMTNC